MTVAWMIHFVGSIYFRDDNQLDGQTCHKADNRHPFENVMRTERGDRIVLLAHAVLESRPEQTGAVLHGQKVLQPKLAFICTGDFLIVIFHWLQCGRDLVD